MHPPDWNLSFIRAGLGDLEAYLLSKEAFWPMDARPPAGSPPFPQLTLGNLQLSFDELRAVEGDLASAQQAELRRLTSQWEAAQSKSAAAFARKASQEMRSRVNLWAAYVGELSEGHGEGSYPQEVRQRVLAERLRPWLGAEEGRLPVIDGSLKARWQPGDFVWDKRLEPIYPKGKFWFLYGRPRTGK